MNNKESVIKELETEFDPRSARWENRAILDTLQETDGVTAKGLCIAINKKYDAELFTYNSLYNQLQNLFQIEVIRYNALTKEYFVNKKYITWNVEYLPISNYSVWLFYISVFILSASLFINNQYLSTIFTGIVVVGALYLLGQYMGSEFKLNNDLLGLRIVLKEKISLFNRGKEQEEQERNKDKDKGKGKEIRTE